jgi:hypothetical protein
MLTSEQVCTLILEPCLQDGPIALCPTNLKLNNANINAFTIRETIHAKISCLGFKQICKLFFVQLCPGYSDQPHAALDHIRQTSTGSDSQLVTVTVIELSHAECCASVCNAELLRNQLLQ